MPDLLLQVWWMTVGTVNEATLPSSFLGDCLSPSFSADNMTALQDLLVQTYSGKVVAFSEEEVGTYQPTAPASSSPLKKLSSQLSKVCPLVIYPECTPQVAAHALSAHQNVRSKHCASEILPSCCSASQAALGVPTLCQTSIACAQYWALTMM